MKNKINVWLWLFSIIILAVACVFYIKVRYNQERFICNSEFTVANSTSSMSVFSRFIFSSGVGRYDATGEVHQQNKPPITIKRTMRFVYWTINDMIVMVSKDAHPDPEVARAIIPDMPDFFIYKEGAMVIKIYKTGRQTLVLTQEGTPMLFCKKNRTGI